MPGGSRSLPSRPSLRYLRLEAKRRLAAGEFPYLHDAQAAIAREPGLPSWAALKQVVSAQAAPPPEAESHALAQLRWVIDRFAGAAGPGWTPPGQDELAQHFTDQFLAVLPAAGQPAGPVTGLGWLLSPRGDMAVHAGVGPDSAASLAIRIRDNRTHVVLTSRLIPVNSIEARLLPAWTNA